MISNQMQLDLKIKNNGGIHIWNNFSLNNSSANEEIEMVTM